jgi:Spy/CpxP family protein refolding chaperone
MEKLINKNRLLVWAVIALVALNIATIATVIWQTKSNKNFFRRDRFEMREHSGHFMKKLITDKLHLDEQQSIGFDSIEKCFIQKNIAIFQKMNLLREKMIEELTNENPDSAKLIQLTKDLGNLHINLKMNTFEFYYSMKKICKPEQQKELSNFFRGMFITDGMKGGPGMGRGNNERGEPNHRDMKPKFDPPKN